MCGGGVTRVVLWCYWESCNLVLWGLPLVVCVLSVVGTLFLCDGGAYRAGKVFPLPVVFYGFRSWISFSPFSGCVWGF